MSSARVKNDSSYYHITARGNGKQIIFNDDNDYKEYLKLIESHNTNMDIEILAYCLMNNHIHILIYDPEFNMGRLFGKVHSLYARYFNYKYDRIGNLFQGRFDSKGIKDDKQLMAVLRYILKNPEEAGICKPKDYKWSSYNHYGDKSGLVNTSKIEHMFSSFVEFENLINSKDITLGYRHNDIDDEILKNFVKQKFGLEIITEARSFGKKRRDDIVLYLWSKGATYKQIVRLTGVSYGIILRIITKN